MTYRKIASQPRHVVILHPDQGIKNTSQLWHVVKLHHDMSDNVPTRACRTRKTISLYGDV